MQNTKKMDEILQGKYVVTFTIYNYRIPSIIIRTRLVFAFD